MHEAGEKTWSRRRSIWVLAGVTIAVAVMSEVLVGAIEPAAKQLGLKRTSLQYKMKRYGLASPPKELS